MKNKHLLSLLQEGYTTVEVVFENGPNDGCKPWADNRVPPAPRAPARHHTYKVWKEDDVQEGDAVVVERDSGELLVVTVVAAHEVPKIDIDASWDYKWIVQKVDMSNYRSQLKREEDFTAMMLEIERTRQREFLLGQFREGLPEGSNARRMFETATGKLIDAPKQEKETKNDS